MLVIEKYRFHCTIGACDSESAEVYNQVSACNCEFAVDRSRINMSFCEFAGHP
jgi:hypothetical protein